MDKRYRAKVIPLIEGKRQPDWSWEYTHAASIAQASHNLMQRYPYPNYFVEEPIEDPIDLRQQKQLEDFNAMKEAYPKSNPGGLEKLRIALIGMKTDIEREAPELEAMYRGAAEATVAAAKNCDISKTLETYDFVRDVSTMLERRLSSAEFFHQFPNIMAKTASIEKLIQKTIMEALTENCGCNFREDGRE